MSEGVRTPPSGGGFRFKVRGPRDFYGGLALIALAIVAIWTSGDLPGTHGFAFGPGTAPRLFAGLLAIVGALVALGGLLFDGCHLDGAAPDVDAQDDHALSLRVTICIAASLATGWQPVPFGRPAGARVPAVAATTRPR